MKHDPYYIGNHGAIGDTYSMALINTAGAIDWCSFPRFDSSPFFFSILDKEKGGECSVEIKGGRPAGQHYVEDTNVLETVIRSRAGTCKITDFMPIEEFKEVEYSRHECHRIISCERGSCNGVLRVRPLLGFGKAKTGLELHDNGFVAKTANESVAFSFSSPFILSDGTAASSFELQEGETLPFVIRYDEQTTLTPKMEYSGKMLERTIAFWRKWLRSTKYSGDWREEVKRSALVLKLLTYSPTGAIVAAGTTSLPEAAGHSRNWDYRYSWIRDSSYALTAFRDIGHLREEARYFSWIFHLLRNDPDDVEKLRVMYTVEGDDVPAERILSELSGYRNSKPVRIGNGARNQLQLDIFGALVDAVCRTFGGRKPPDELWRICDSIAKFLMRNYKRKDAGIWEIRGKRYRNTHSAVMAWLALREVSMLAEKLRFRKRAKMYELAAERVRNFILTHSIDNGSGMLSRAPGTGEIDASVLLAITRGFISPDSDIAKATLKAVEETLMKNGFVYRYRIDDGLDGEEGAFYLCTFWYIQALAISGKISKARRLFEHVLKYSNHLGLMSEEIDPLNGEMLGNFPQTFSHLGLIETATVLSRIERLHARRHSWRHTSRHSSSTT